MKTRGGKNMKTETINGFAPPDWRIVSDLREKVKKLEADLEMDESLRNRDGEYIKILEGARSDAEFSLAYNRAELTAERAKVKALEERKRILETHVEGAKAEIGSVVIILKILRGLRPRQGDAKRGLVDKLVSRLEFWEARLGK